jgi:hypothetical protein
MRPDVVPGALSREHELSDHRGMRRTLSELQGGDPLVLVPPCGGFCPKDRRQHEGLLQPPPRDAGRLLPPRDDLDRQRHRDQWVSYCSRGPGGRFSRTPAAECRRRPTSRSVPRTQPDDSSHPCYWSHACVSNKIYKGYWFFGRPTLQELCPDVRTCCNAAVPIGSRGGMIGDGRRMAMRYPVRRRSTRHKRMGGMMWSLRSNTRPKKSRGCVNL